MVGLAVGETVGVVVRHQKLGNADGQTKMIHPAALGTACPACMRLGTSFHAKWWPGLERLGASFHVKWWPGLEQM